MFVCGGLAACVALGIVAGAAAQDDAPPAAELSLRTEAPEEVPAGTPFSIRVVAEYYGAFDVRLQLEDAEEWTNLRLVERSSTDRAWSDAAGRQRVERVFELTVVAPEEGRARMPGIPVEYLLDGQPARKTADPARIRVTARQVPLRERLFWPAVAVLGLGAAAAAVAIGMRAVRAARTKRLARPATPRQLLEQELVALRQARLAGQSQPYFTQAERVLYRWLALAYGVDERPASPETLQRRLELGNLPVATIERIAGVARRCYEGKFAPASVTREDLARFEGEIMALVEGR